MIVFNFPAGTPKTTRGMHAELYSPLSARTSWVMEQAALDGGSVVRFMMVVDKEQYNLNKRYRFGNSGKFK